MHQAHPASGPALRGGMLALSAAVLFGISTPLVQRFGAGIGSFTTAALLYAGAALLGALMRLPVEREAGVRGRDVPRLASMALFGAVVGPVALAWGLQRTGGTGASLMLALEAVFTAVLARLWYHEAMDRRVTGALALLTLGGMALVADRAQVGAAEVTGLLAVLSATAAWGVDNTLSRGVADRDPGQVVMLKGALGALATVLIAVAVGEPWPMAVPALALLAVGATGYGLSLRFYLLAQRAFGAARTGSVFACAPFIGAACAYGLGERGGTAWLGAGAGLMAAGIVLHLTERHGHEHLHDEAEHEHAHRHDDGHHHHHHGPEDHHDGPQKDAFLGLSPASSASQGFQVAQAPHSHWHRHEPVQHRHPHVPDKHHAHRH